MRRPGTFLLSSDFVPKGDQVQAIDRLTEGLESDARHQVLKGVTGSGANAPVEEIMSKRADVAPIDNSAWPNLAKQGPGLMVFPLGDDCLKSNEMATDVGMAVDKKDTVFRDWLQAVYDSMKDQVTNEEISILKGE